MTSRWHSFAVRVDDEMDEQDVVAAFRGIRAEISRARASEIAAANERSRAGGPRVGTIMASALWAAGTMSARDLFKRGLVKEVTR